jgi:hypothetical protein
MLQEDTTFKPQQHSGICGDMWIFQLLGSDSCPAACNRKVCGAAEFCCWRAQVAVARVTVLLPLFRTLARINLDAILCRARVY